MAQNIEARAQINIGFLNDSSKVFYRNRSIIHIYIMLLGWKSIDRWL